MLAQNYKRGFSTERLKVMTEPKVKYDEGGFYINTISENVKVYFEDYYEFLESSYDEVLRELKRIETERASYNEEWAEYHRNEHSLEIERREVIALAPLVALMLVTGLYPNWVLEVINSGVVRFLGG